MNNVLKKAIVTSLFIALAVGLEVLIKEIPILNSRFPSGGQIFGISVVPILLVGLYFGYGYGIAAGVIFGLLNFVLDGSFIHWGSIFFDYIFAFGVLGITGIIKDANKSKINTIVLVFVACFIRYIFHSLSGVIFFGEYAPEGTNVFFYSFILYNGPYSLSTTILSLLIIIGVNSPLNQLKENYFHEYKEIEDSNI